MRHQNNYQVKGVHREKKQHTKCTQQMKSIEYETTCSGEGTIRIKEKKENVGMERKKKTFGTAQHTLNIQS